MIINETKTLVTYANLRGDFVDVEVVNRKCTHMRKYRVSASNSVLYKTVSIYPVSPDKKLTPAILELARAMLNK